MALSAMVSVMARACASVSPPPPPSPLSPPPLSAPPPSSPLFRKNQVHFPNPSSPVSLSCSAHDPSLAFANLLWFKGSYNVQIFVGETEPADSVVRRFRRAVMQAGIISECRRRRFFETPIDIAKRKRQAAQRRKSKRFFQRPLNDQKKDAAKANADQNDDDDNWEYDGIADEVL